MDINQLNQKLENIQSSNMKSSKALSEMTVEGAKKLTQVHASLANHVAKNMQLAAANLITAKSPQEAWNVMKGDGGTPFIEGWQQYQKSIAGTIEHYFEDFSEAHEEIYEHTKDGINEVFKLTCQNAPDGMDVLIRPYQSAVNIVLEGADQVHALTKSYIHNLESNFSGGGILGNITDLMPSAFDRKYSRKSESVKKSL